MSRSLSTIGRRRGHSLPPLSATSSHVVPSRGELEEWYEFSIDLCLDVTGPLRPSTHAAIGQWASPSLCAQSADREDDLIDHLLDALDNPDLTEAEESVIQSASSEPTRLPTCAVDALVVGRIDPRLNGVTVSGAGPSGAGERTSHDGSSDASVSQSATDQGRQGVQTGSHPQRPPPSSISEPGEVIGPIATESTGRSSSRAPAQPEPLSQEVEELLQSGPLPDAAQSRPRSPTPEEVQSASLREEPTEDLSPNGPLPCASSSGPSGSRISLDAIKSASLREDGIEERLQYVTSPRVSREHDLPIPEEATLMPAALALPDSDESSGHCRAASPLQDDLEECLINGPSSSASRDPGVSTLAVPKSDHPGSGYLAALASNTGPHVLPDLIRSSYSFTGKGGSPSRGEATRKRRLPPSPSPPQNQSRKRSKHADNTAAVNVKPIEGPAFWTRVARLSPGVPLWAAVVTIEVDGETDASSRPLALVCTRPLDLVPVVRHSIVLDLSHRLNIKQARSDPGFPLPCVRTRITNAGALEALNGEQVQLAMRWTREVLALHVERVVQSQLDPQKYLLLPMVSQRSQNHAEDRPEKVVIDWDEIRMLDRGVSRPVTEGLGVSASPDDLRDKVLFDHYRPMRRLLVESWGYVPRTPILGPEARSSHCTSQSSGPSVWSITVDRSEAFHSKKTGAQHEQFTTTHLHRLGAHARVSFLSTTVFRSTSLIPAIASAIDDTLLGLEVSQTLFDSIISPEATLTAITLPGAAPGRSSSCYERLELLGDTVLHLLCVIGLRFTTGSGGAASKAKSEMQKLESNANLRRLALEAGLLRYVRSESPWEAVWGPSGRTIFERKRPRKEEETSLGAKRCADVVEALIGAAFLHGHGSLRLALVVMEKLKFRLPRVQEITFIAEKAGELDPDLPDGDVENIHEVWREPRHTTVSGSTTIPRPRFYSLEWLDQVASILGCDMTNCKETCRLLNRGTLDKWKDSWGGTGLGFEVLYTCTLTYLFRRLPFAPPATLSPLVQSLVSTECLAAFCVTSGLVDTILRTSPEEQRLIQDYKIAVTAATSGTGGDHREIDEFWTEIQAPSFLAYYVAVLFEGIICDADSSWKPARTVFRTRLRPFFEKYCRAVTDGTVPKGRRLGVFLREKGCHGLEVTVNQDPREPVGQRGVASVMVHDKLWEARGPSTAIARQIATRKALEQLLTLPPSAYCTCSTQTKGKGKAINQDLQPSGRSDTGNGDSD